MAMHKWYLLVMIRTNPRKDKQETIRTLISMEGVLIMLVGSIKRLFLYSRGFKVTNFQGEKRIH